MIAFLEYPLDPNHSSAHQESATRVCRRKPGPTRAVVSCPAKKSSRPYWRFSPNRRCAERDQYPRLERKGFDAVSRDSLLPSGVHKAKESQPVNRCARESPLDDVADRDQTSL